MPDMFVDVGQGVFVKADESVAVHDDIPIHDPDFKPTIPAWRTAKSLVVLRSGQVIPGYLKAHTIRRRVEQALGGDS